MLNTVSNEPKINYFLIKSVRVENSNSLERNNFNYSNDDALHEYEIIQISVFNVGGRPPPLSRQIGNR